LALNVHEINPLKPEIKLNNYSKHAVPQREHTFHYIEGSDNIV